MDSYFEIRAIPDPELLQSAVVAQLMQDLHKLLPAFDGRVGVSFPGYGQARTLGGIIRLHGSLHDLERLNFEVRNDPGMRSYGLIFDVSSVPENVKGFARFQRLHVKGGSHLRRLQQRHRSRGTWTKELEESISQKYEAQISCPHVSLKSASTGQPRFLLFIERYGSENSVDGEFNAYGLSRTATVPLF